MSTIDFTLPYDKTGLSAANFIDREPVALYGQDIRIGIVEYVVYFIDSLKLWTENASGEKTYLTKDQFAVSCVDVDFILQRRLTKTVACSFLVTDTKVLGTVYASYQALGGADRVSAIKLRAAVESLDTR